MRRRDFIGAATQRLALLGVGDQLLRRVEVSPLGGAAAAAIDRKARVARHSPVVRVFESFSALSVGNGGFAFTADATGLQTFPESYPELPLATQAEWGWHAYPDTDHVRIDDALVMYDAHGRKVPYASGQNGAAGKWLRENPHRLSLARIGFVLTRADGSAARASDLTDVVQRLDLWSGTLESRFRLDGRAVTVYTWAHPERDIVAMRVESADLDSRRLAVRIAFPYGGATHTGDPADWSRDAKHRTAIVSQGPADMELRRTLDGTEYFARLAFSSGSTARQFATHEFRVEPNPGTSVFECVASFTPHTDSMALPSARQVRTSSAAHWQWFWEKGGTLDLSGSTDSRAPELERRIVLSEYLTAINCAGTIPPQETGETFNSWFGKPHLEMHWWHAAQFALWGRAPLLERSLPWYRKILPVARANAQRQGYRGARWPKMVDPDGNDSPSGIGVFLIWQQPHPIYLAELVYRAKPSRAILEAHREMVFASAEFMASYPFWDGTRYVLGPPLIPAQESHPPATTFNPTFELAYWQFGLETAQRWRQRLGLSRNMEWDRVIRNLSPMPMRDGLYVNAESAPTTWTDAVQRRDHPTLLGAYGFVGSPRVDRDAMRRTLRRTVDTWQWDDTWGWDYPLVAMTAARLGEREIAIDVLMMTTQRNRYHPNGHNYQRPGLTIYLPGNGGLLAAVAMMAAGWDGAPRMLAPGFPRAGWTVRSEGLRALP